MGFRHKLFSFGKRCLGAFGRTAFVIPTMRYGYYKPPDRHTADHTKQVGPLFLHSLLKKSEYNFCNQNVIFLRLKAISLEKSGKYYRMGGHIYAVFHCKLRIEPQHHHKIVFIQEYPFFLSQTPSSKK